MPDSILIIESKPALRRKLISVLSEAGFDAAGVADYPEALLKLDGGKPDMVIVDEVLPGRGGLEACRELHSDFGLPVILMGTDSGDEVWKRAVAAGADLYLKKPFSYRKLVARVKAILRRYKAIENRGEKDRTKAYLVTCGE